MTTEPKAITQADLDRALDSIAALEKKNEELVTETRKAKEKARAAEGVDPADYARLENENEKLRGDLAKATKDVSAFTKRAEDAEKALAVESETARNNAIDLALADHASKIGVASALAGGFKALHRANLKAELVAGKYAVTTADGKDPTEYFTGIATSEDGKHWIAAPVNTGGGAMGGKGGASGKTMTRAEFNALDQMSQATAGAAMAKGELQILPDKAA